MSEKRHEWKSPDGTPHSLICDDHGRWSLRSGAAEFSQFTGWHYILAGELLRLSASVQFMTDRAINEKLDGYRELGARAAAAENERDQVSAALAVAEGENTKLRETLANVYKVPGVISAVGDHVEKARNGGSENG